MNIKGWNAHYYSSSSRCLNSENISAQPLNTTKTPPQDSFLTLKKYGQCPQMKHSKINQRSNLIANAAP